MPMKELIKFLNMIEDRREPYYIAEELLINIYPKYNTTNNISKSNDNIFYIEYSIEIGWVDKSIQPIQNIVTLSNFYKADYEGYLVNTLKKMRLFKEGNIIIPYYFYYHGTIDNPTVVTRPQKIPIYSFDEYSLDQTEIKQFKSFLNEKMYFSKEKFLKTAFECYNLSYEINKINLQFLMIMTGLEVLFVSKGEEKIKKTVSRSTAIVIGNISNGEKIYNKMLDFYKIRNEIVHGGEDGLVNRKDLLLLRNYLRESIKEMNIIIKEEPNLHGENGKINLERFKNDNEYKKRTFKQNISYLLYFCKFGSKPWRNRINEVVG